MKKIASFTVNHDLLEPGIYLSRRDGDVDTWDIRLIKPNTPPFMSVPATHTIEHLGATIARSSEYSENVVYFGPMGCRTGFYLLTRDLDTKTVISLIQRMFEGAADWSEEIPGNSRIECGNYLDHDLDGARALAEKYCSVIKNWTEEMTVYRS